MPGRSISEKNKKNHPHASHNHLISTRNRVIDMKIHYHYYHSIFPTDNDVIRIHTNHSLKNHCKVRIGLFQRTRIAVT